MEDRPDGEVAFERLERLFHFHELKIVAPQLGRIVVGEICTQEISSFAPSYLPQLLAVQPIAERGAVGGQFDGDQAQGAKRLLACGTELHSPPLRQHACW